MMGRNHARILPQLENIEFIGGADPLGDPYRSLGAYPLHNDALDMLKAGVDAVVLAIPPEEHEKWAHVLAEAGVHTLIEKPLAADLPAARRIRDAFSQSEASAGVGYVERFNPALRELKKRLNEGALGSIFSITTRRVGPYPLRVRDVGVVTDLATHDIDILHWLGGEITQINSQLASRLGRPHEDLIEANGYLDNGCVFSLSVNWLTPRKERSVTVLGERGALVADLLGADLTFYANAAVPAEWDAMARIKGVAEGDIVRYGLRKPEPLKTELETFVDAIQGGSMGQLASLDDGVRTMQVARRILDPVGDLK
jgi:predicted dehydrogenase